MGGGLREVKDGRQRDRGSMHSQLRVRTHHSQKAIMRKREGGRQVRVEKRS